MTHQHISVARSELLKQLIRGRTIFFLGAGFASLSSNRFGRLPMGDGLKKFNYHGRDDAGVAGIEGCRIVARCRRWRPICRWKVAAGLAITDPGFHPTGVDPVAQRRGRIDAERIFGTVRDVIEALTNVLYDKTRRALDSTLLDDAVATQDTVTQLVSMIRESARFPTPPPRWSVTTIRLASGKPSCRGTTRLSATNSCLASSSVLLSVLGALDGG